ncbi:MAG: response regulator, partial [Geminicoccaceae bacterium]|nr:response regulator [Geminicoccaceae bacterium]
MTTRRGKGGTGLREVGPGFVPGPSELVRLPAGGGSDARGTLRLLLVGDDGDDLIPALLKRAPAVRFAVLRAGSADAALRRLAAERVDACLIDLALPGRDGLDLVRLVQARGFDLPLLLMVEGEDEGVERAALAAGVDDFVDKEEVDAGRLERMLRFAVARFERRQRLDWTARFDPLTGLARPPLFEERLERALAGAKRRGGRLAVCIVDLSGVEAEEGSAATRRLRTLADRLCARLRETDTVARMGGRTWAILFENLVRPEDALLVAGKALAALKDPTNGDPTNGDPT